MSVLYVEEDGVVWTIPLMEVVINYANYYADLESKRGADYNEVRVDAIKEGRENPDEMAEWYVNNMNISDVASNRYRIIHRPTVPPIPTDISDCSVTVENPVK